ncbi:MAG: hypothetical protein ABI409_13220 [Ramlibacter sp.]
MKTDPKRKQVSELRRSMTAEQWTQHWKAVMAAAQLDTHTDIAGKEYQRLPYGTPGADSALYATCPDCAVEIGQLHVRNCDTEVCPSCGGRALGCDCGDSADRQLH